MGRLRLGIEGKLPGGSLGHKEDKVDPLPPALLLRGKWQPDATS
jgi:hypothetical protein